MNQTEKMFLEAIGNMFKNNPSTLGIVPRPKGDNDVTSETSQFKREYIDDMFTLKTLDSAFHEDLCGAFKDIHSYKYLDDPHFDISFKKRCSARAIPTEECVKALKYIEDIKKELGGENYQEKQSGWHTDIDEIADMTRNADNRKPKSEVPYEGAGGPAPKKDEI